MVKKDKLTIEIEVQEEIRNVETLKLQNLIDRKEKRDLIPLAKSYLGKCFKYRNSAGASYAKWWLYVKVVKVKGLTIYFISFQKTSLGKIEFEVNNTTIIWKDIEPFDDDYIEITKEEFEDERKVLLQEIKILGKDI